jgi:2-aminobenzoate-CoA ligase
MNQPPSIQRRPTGSCTTACHRPSSGPQLRYDLPELQALPHSSTWCRRCSTAPSPIRPRRPPAVPQRRAHPDLRAGARRGEPHRAMCWCRLGLVPGNRVLLRGGNSIAMALAWLAVVQSGLIAVATMPLLRATELKAIIDKARPAAALCDVKLQDELKTALALEPGDSRPAAAPVQHRRRRHGAGPIAGIARETRQRPRPPCPTAGRHRLAGLHLRHHRQPKAAVHTHRDVLAACETWPRHVLRATPDDIVMGSPPLAFTFGLGGLLVFPMWAGASVYFPSIPYTPEAMVKLMARSAPPSATPRPPSTGRWRRSPSSTAWPAAHQRQRRRRPARRHPPALEGGQRHRDARRHRRHRDVPHLHLGCRPRRAARRHRPVVPGYQAKVVDDHGQEVPAAGRAAGGDRPHRLPLPGRRAPGQYVQDGWNFPGDAFLQDEDGYFSTRRAPTT